MDMAQEDTVTVAFPDDLDQWGCDTCSVVVLIPADAGVTGGVCPHQKRGCAGSIAKINGTPRSNRAIVGIHKAGLEFQPWLVAEFGPNPRDTKP